MRLLLDTSAYSLAMRNHSDAVALMREADELIICPITVGELFPGFARGGREADNCAVFKEFIGSTRVRLATISMDTGDFYAKVLNDLRSKGKPIPTNDIWIAACTMECGARLATGDEHFRLVPGLLCEFVDAKAG